jgi:hypothetical protein
MAEWIGGKTKAITAESREARIKCRTRRIRAGRQKKATKHKQQQSLQNFHTVI